MKKPHLLGLFQLTKYPIEKFLSTHHRFWYYTFRKYASSIKNRINPITNCILVRLGLLYNNDLGSTFLSCTLHKQQKFEFCQHFLRDAWTQNVTQFSISAIVSTIRPQEGNLFYFLLFIAVFILCWI